MSQRSQRSAALRLDWGVALKAQPGQVEGGDAWVVETITDGFLVAVIDGLGHGAAAAVAAERAVEIIKGSASLPLDEIFRECHQALLASRGAAISVARIDTGGESLTWLGVGNVEGLVLNPVAFSPPVWHREALLGRGGVVGYELPTLRPVTIPFKPGAFLVFTTDGVRQGFAAEVGCGRRAQLTADHILAGYGRGTDDALVTVAQLLRGGSDQDP